MSTFTALGDIENLSERERELVLIWVRTYDQRVFDGAMNYVKSRRKPSEPKGLGAVVEDSAHRLWVRVSNTPGTFPWLRDGEGVRGWSEFDAVRVLSEGVKS